MTRHTACPKEKIHLFGYSRGAVAAIMLAHQLEHRDIKVDFMGLIEPVTTRIVDRPKEPLQIAPTVLNFWLGVKDPQPPFLNPVLTAKTSKPPTETYKFGRLGIIPAVDLSIYNHIDLGRWDINNSSVPLPLKRQNTLWEKAYNDLKTAANRIGGVVWE